MCSGVLSSAICAVILASALLAHGQPSGPTLKETVEYLNGKLSLCPRPNQIRLMADGAGEVEVTGPNVMWGEAEGEPNRHYELRKQHKVIFNLRDLWADVTISDNVHLQKISARKAVSVTCSSGDCIHVAESDFDSGPFERFSYIPDFTYRNATASRYSFFSCRDDDTERIQKALTYAITRSGGKEELF